MSEFVYCLNTSTIRPTGLLRKIELAGAAGYQAIELWDDDVTAFYQGGGSQDDLERALGDAGLKVVSMIALGDWLTARGHAYGKMIEVCGKKMDRAAALGSPYIVASPPQEVVDLDEAAGRFGTLMRLGKEAGIAPAMEFLGFVDGVNTLAKAWEIVENCGEAGGTIVADVFHMMRGGGSVDDLLLIPGDRLACFHLNDVPAEPSIATQTDGDRVMLGEGVADLPRVIRNLRTIGYGGAVSLELFNRELWAADAAGVVKMGIERMRGLME